MQDIAKVFPGRDESTPQIVKAVVQLLYQVNRSAKKKWPDVLGSAFPDVKLFPPSGAIPMTLWSPPVKAVSWIQELKTSKYITCVRLMVILLLCFLCSYDEVDAMMTSPAPVKRPRVNKSTLSKHSE